MRKQDIILISTFIVLLISQVLSAQTVTDAALALKMKGEAVRKPAGVGTVEESVSVGMWFSDYDSIRTAAASYLAILFADDKSLIKVRENSNLTIRGEVSAQRVMREIKVDRGAILTDVSGGQKGIYQIATPVSVASVKGTLFWLLSDPSGYDTFIGLQGNVEVLNLTSGQTLLLTPGMTVTSTWTGGMNMAPTDPSSIPMDPDSEVPAPPDEGMGQPPTIPPPSEGGEPTPEEPSGESQPSPPSPAEGATGGVGMAASVGAVVIDDQVYNQINLRPEIPLGPFGIGLDINLYIDADGNIRKEDWDEPLDAVDKIYYLRFHQPEDALYFRGGALDNITLGQGLIMDNYTNTIEYPQIRRTGLFGHYTFGKIRLQGLVANLRELSSPGLLGARATMKLFGPLQIGATVVVDGDQYAGLSDKDDDGVPDQVDDFPDDKEYQLDSDGDGVADAIDPDIDGDGYTDNASDPTKNVDDDGISPHKTAFELGDLSRDAAIVTGADIEFPILKGGFVGITAYGEAAAIKDYGFGFAFPGVRASIGPVSLRAEFRRFSKEFVGNYFNRTYDIERATLIDSSGTTIARTREKILLEQFEDPLMGVFGSAAFNLMDYVVFSAAFQALKSDNSEAIVTDNQSLFADISINPVLIPKLSRASLYYQQTNVENVFDFDKTPSTVQGYLLGYELAQNVMLLLRYQQTYIDKNGDGVISGPDETIVLTGVETEFSF